jgi:hypothetical protein
MEVLATGAIFTGTLDDLARAFRLTPDDFQGCLRELVRAGSLTVYPQPADRLTVRVEHRSPGPPPPTSEDRRQPIPNAWQL